MMYEILKKYGHTINKIYPALIPLTVKESFIKKLQGISMRNVEISCKIKKEKDKSSWRYVVCPFWFNRTSCIKIFIIYK